jgi:DNA-binding MarR family transcriptional regulator
MTAERRTEKPKDLGIEKEEAGIYIFISAMRPTPARIVARRFNLNRMRVYKSLKSLEEKGLVQKVMTIPVETLCIYDLNSIVQTGYTEMMCPS